MKPLFTLTILVAIAACSPQITVYSDADPDFNVNQYKTFDWGQKGNIEDGKNPLHYNELNDKRIKSAVAAQLDMRGYQHTTVKPELILHYHIIIDDQSVVITEPYGYRYGPYWLQMQSNVYAYREGTLILDVMDSKTNSLIWRGWAVAAIDNVNPEDADEMIKTTVRKIFKKFPKTQRHSNTSEDIVLN